MTSMDWKQLVTVVLEHGPQLEWSSWLTEEVKAFEQGKARGFEIS